MTLRVLIADDQEIIRSGLKMILESEPDITVVETAANGDEAVRLARSSVPDVCLLDIRMPKLDGIEATAALAGPDVERPIPVVVLTTFDDDENVHHALAAGASGFLLKDVDTDLLVRAVRAAADGDALIAPAITARLLKKFASPENRPEGLPEFEQLSEREEQILQDVAKGYTNLEIAEHLHISLNTVKSHLKSLMMKLNTRNRVELAIWAHRTGRM